MPDIWNVLATARQQRALCTSDVDAIKGACLGDHHHEHVIECSQCYTQILDRMQSRYTASPDTECFTGQAGVFEDLHRLFAEAKQHGVALDVVEERVAAARKGWIRQAMGASQAVRRLMRDSGQTHLLQKLEDETVPLDSTLGEIRIALGPRPVSDQDLDNFLHRLTSMQPANEGLRSVQDIFFSDFEEDSPAAGRGTELIGLQGGSPVDAILEQRLEKSAASKTAGDLKAKHRRRLDELRRARAAHENLKTKRTKHRQVGSGKPPNTRSSVDSPPCTVCSAFPDAKSLVACPLCQVRADLDGLGHCTIYCSDVCYQGGYDSHLNDAHECASGDDCIQLKTEADDVVDEEQSIDAVVLCGQCLDSMKLVTPYCSKACAEAGIQAHSERAHGPRQGLEHSNAGDAHGKANSRQMDMAACLTPLSEVLDELEKRNSVTFKPLD